MRTLRGHSGSSGPYQSTMIVPLLSLSSAGRSTCCICALPFSASPTAENATLLRWGSRAVLPDAAVLGRAVSSGGEDSLSVLDSELA